MQTRSNAISFAISLPVLALIVTIGAAYAQPLLPRAIKAPRLQSGEAAADAADEAADSSEEGDPSPPQVTTRPTAGAEAQLEISTGLLHHLRHTIRDSQQEIERLTGKTPKTAVPNETKTKPAAPRAQSGQTSISQTDFTKLIESLGNAEKALARLQAKTGQKPPTDKKSAPRVFLDVPYLGMAYVPPNRNMRYFVARLVAFNSTTKSVVIKRSEMQLDAAGKTFQSVQPSQQVKQTSYMVGKQSFYIGNLKFPAEVTIPAGKSGSVWTVFENLPSGGNVPAMSLSLKLADKAVVIDVNKSSRDILGLSVERIGPRKSLGLLTIAGTLNMVNIGSLVDELDQLSADKVSRAVIRWEKSAPPSDSQIISWLQQAAHQAGRNQQNNNNRFPIVPAAIHELHLAALPNQNGGSTNYSPYGQNAPARIHKTDQQAVSAALRTAYEVLPRDELILEIEQGHPLTRAAALEGGGGRLLSDDLPLILQHAGGDSPTMRRAAFIALSQFGEPEAIVALSKFAMAEKDPLAAVAIESLAASRYASAHAELLKLLNAASPKLKKEIVTIVARYPRPLWSDTVYEYATSGDADVAIIALQALVSIGHPQLIDVLADSLHRGTQAFQAAAFKILAVRTDSRSEELAMQYALKQMEKKVPTSEMLQLFQRTRDRRAVPLLLAHFEKSKQSRQTVIQTLVLIGDQSVVDVLLKQYSSLNTNEKSVVLTMLRQFRSPKFRELAGAALVSKDNTLVNVACQGLQQDGSPQAVTMLIAAFDKTKNRSAWSYISNALASLGTQEARAALVKGTQSKDTNRRSYSINALRTLRTRSPGYRYIYQGKNFDRQKKWKEAIEQYTLAAQIDPQLPEAFSGRGNALLRQEKYKEAGVDLEKALKLDPFDSMTLTGLSIVRVMQGKTSAGIELVERNRKMFVNDAMYAYNTACVYGRALEAAKKDMKADDREKKITKYQKQALEDLRRSLKLGFRDKAWMKKDPDLKSLHDLDEFKKILSGADANNGKRAVLPQPVLGGGLFAVP